MTGAGVTGVTDVAVVTAAVLHLGFQGTVTALVYSALAQVAPADWSRVHDAHSRRIVPLVAVCYLLLAGSLVLALVRGPVDGWLVVAGIGALLAAGTTAAVAAPLHGRLGRGHDPVVVSRLLRVDRVRLLGALLAAVGAVGWALAGR